MALTDEGKKIMLEAWGAEAVEIALYRDDGGTPVELSGSGYARQSISWTYNSTDVILEADKVALEDYIATFDVPAGSIDYVGFHKVSAGAQVALHALGAFSEEYTNAGTYEILEASLEIVDPT